jgi:hypothetical protein
MRQFLGFLLGYSCLCFGQTGSVSIALSSTGLSSLRYRGVEYIGIGDFHLNSVKFQDGASGNLQSTASVNTATGEITWTYDWGTVKAGYSASGNRLNLTITTTNTSGSTIQGIYFEAMALRFPSKPKEYAGNTPLLATNIGNPTTVRMTCGGSALVLANDDVTKPLLVGFPWAYDRPSPQTLFPLRVNTDREEMYPDSLPTISRPILPGGSDQYRLSLRFGPASASMKDLAGDVYQSFAKFYPFQLNWPDRRTIGNLIIGTAAAGWATNPRGWLLDPNINVTTPAGVAAFQARLLGWADGAVAILKSMNSQGMITWDIEGEQFPHATTYIGDPRIFAQLAPEMSGVADAYFKKFRDAGLRVGVTIRPQQLVVSADGTSASQNDAADPSQILIDKIAFARSRWGATLFYIDSNGDPNNPMDVSVFKRVTAAHPDVLLIPEHQNAAYYSITAPYDELRGGVASTPQWVRDIYPNAFSVINTSDGSIDQRFSDLRAAVQNGDVMLFRGWFADKAIDKVRNLGPFGSAPAGPAPDRNTEQPGQQQQRQQQPDRKRDGKR